MSVRRGLAVAALALSLAAAAPADKVIHHPGGGPSLIVPAATPLRFTGFDENGTAHFSGHLTLTGTFIYGCEFDCEGPITDDLLVLQLLPDRRSARMIPYWQDRGDKLVIDIDDRGRFKAALAGRPRLAEVMAGKADDIRGTITLEIDNYSADFGCDYSPAYSARLVAIDGPIDVAQVEADGDFGCG